ncbi:putative KRAB box and zinc finger C2H2 type domain containing protein, partial [Operophtera brumata]
MKQLFCSGRTALRRHIPRHMDSKRFACDACGKTFVERYALTRHARVHTGERAEKRHACADCGKRYGHMHALARSGSRATRVARRSGHKPFQCVVCGKAFPSRRLLASHRLVHSDLKPYACDYCDKRFRHESTRNTHHRTHTGEKPYVCSICGKTFIQGSNMRLHMRTHTGEKPYACSRCDSSFARLNVKLHMRLHSGEKPFACSACPKKYVSASLLRDHCRAHTDNIITTRAPPNSKPAEHIQNGAHEVVAMPMQQVADDIPNAIVELTLGTHETFDMSQELVFQDHDVKTH